MSPIISRHTFFQITADRPVLYLNLNRFIVNYPNANHYNLPACSMKKPSKQNYFKKLIIGMENLPDWKPVAVTELGPEQARFHDMGLSRKKLQYEATSVFSESGNSGNDQGIPFFNVPLEKCVSANLFSYAPGKWHPFTVSLRRYGAGQRDEAEEMFSHFFHTFKPEILREFFFGMPEYPWYDSGNEQTRKESEEVGNSIIARKRFPGHSEWPTGNRKTRFGGISKLPVNKGKIHEPECNIPAEIHNDTFEDTAFPWSWRSFPAPGAIKGKRKQHRLYFGPESDQGIKAEWKRLTRLFEDIARNGYRDDFATPVDGYLICSGDDYRFMIRRGKHRVAVLSALGYTHVMATFTPGRPRSYDEELISKWPKIVTGKWSEKDAKEVIRRCFACRYHKADPPLSQ